MLVVLLWIALYSLYFWFVREDLEFLLSDVVEQTLKSQGGIGAFAAASIKGSQTAKNVYMYLVGVAGILFFALVAFLVG